jgi:hypothetical protein
MLNKLTRRLNGVSPCFSFLFSWFRLQGLVGIRLLHGPPFAQTSNPPQLVATASGGSGSSRYLCFLTWSSLKCLPEQSSEPGKMEQVKAQYPGTATPGWS